MVSVRPGTISLLGAVVVVTGLLLAGCGGLRVEPGAGASAGVSTGVSTGSTAGPVSAQRPAGHPSRDPAASVVGQRLRSMAGGDRVALVPLGAGRYDGATYDQAGHISFWSYGDGGWTRAGASTYPFSAALQPVDATVSGALLTGMAHATFVVDGTFTTDHADNSVAFTPTDTGRWGVIKGGTDGRLVPSGRPVTGDGIGLENGFYLVAGQLETADCSATLPMASCGGDSRVLKFWAWNDGAFVLVRTAGLGG